MAIELSHDAPGAGRLTIINRRRTTLRGRDGTPGFQRPASIQQPWRNKFASPKTCGAFRSAPTKWAPLAISTYRFVVAPRLSKRRSASDRVEVRSALPRMRRVGHSMRAGSYNGRPRNQDQRSSNFPLGARIQVPQKSGTNDTARLWHESVKSERDWRSPRIPNSRSRRNSSTPLVPLATILTRKS